MKPPPPHTSLTIIPPYPHIITISIPHFAFTGAIEQNSSPKVWIPESSATLCRDFMKRLSALNDLVELISDSHSHVKNTFNTL